MRTNGATLKQRNRVARRQSFRVAENRDRGLGGVWGNMGARCRLTAIRCLAIQPADKSALASFQARSATTEADSARASAAD